MPKVQVSLDDTGNLVYNYAPARWKTSLDYNEAEINQLCDELTEAGIPFELTVWIADTEAQISTEGRMSESPEEVQKIVKNVSKRLKKKLNREEIKIIARSKEFPMDSPIYSVNFEGLFESILAETRVGYALADPNSDVFKRVESRKAQLTEAGLDEENATERAIRALALQDTEYAMEGIWLKERVDCCLVIEHFPQKAFQRTVRLAGEENLPFIYPAQSES